MLTQSLAILEWLEETVPSRACCRPTRSTAPIVRAMAQIVACDIHPVNNLRIAARP